MRTIAIIPARGGSRGVPGKNVRLLAGKPLIGWTIEQALAARGVDTVVVSTDDKEIARVAAEHGAQVPFVRPVALATDTAPTEPVMTHALEWFQTQGQSFDAVMLLQPTSPLRFKGTIDAAIEQFRSERADSLLGVVENHHFFWRRRGDVEALYDYAHRPRRQDLTAADRWYRETGSIYLSTTEAFRRSGNRLSGSISLFQMAEAESWEIDSEADFAVLSALFEYSHAH